MANEQTKCVACNAEIPLDEDNDGHLVLIQRGWFHVDDEDGITLENIKAELILCKKCYLEDEDLCRFFNRIGYQIR